MFHCDKEIKKNDKITQNHGEIFEPIMRKKHTIKIKFFIIACYVRKKAYICHCNANV